MSSDPRRALPSLLILSLTALLVSGCASRPPIVTIPNACSSLIAPSLRADVKPVDLPALDATAGDLWVSFDGQTGKLDTANTFKRAVIETVEACEKRDAEVAKKLQPRPWWRFW